MDYKTVKNVTIKHEYGEDGDNDTWGGPVGFYHQDGSYTPYNGGTWHSVATARALAKKLNVPLETF